MDFVRYLELALAFQCKSVTTNTLHFTDHFTVDFYYT
jgi:hypothetical protein